jgi:hypothetical protein
VKGRRTCFIDASIFCCVLHGTKWRSVCGGINMLMTGGKAFVAVVVFVVVALQWCKCFVYTSHERPAAPRWEARLIGCATSLIWQ